MDPSRFDIGIVSYYRDRAAAVLFKIEGLFCRRCLHVPWYPQPDVVKPIMGVPVPTPFGVYLFLVSLVVFWRHRPHVAYLNSGVSEFGPAILAARLFGTKVVCALRMSRELSADERRLVVHVHQFVTSSQWAARFYRARAQGRVDAECIYEGIDLVEFDAQARERRGPALPEGPVYVCQVGSLIARKRPGLAVEAFEIARRQCSNLKLVLVGEGPLRQELEDLVRKYGLQSEVLLLGHRPDVPALLQSSHIGLLLSEDEGLPNAVLEYMAAGLPVVTARLPFIDELVRDDHNGLVVDGADPRAIADRILTLARSSAYRERLGRAGRTMIEAGPFGVQREAQSVEMLLTRVVLATASRT
jgi:glycosyltransferase involved in cell wall biosynthesis